MATLISTTRSLPVTEVQRRPKSLERGLKWFLTRLGLLAVIGKIELPKTTSNLSQAHTTAAPRSHHAVWWCRPQTRCQSVIVSSTRIQSFNQCWFYLTARGYTQGVTGTCSGGQQGCASYHTVVPGRPNVYVKHGIGVRFNPTLHSATSQPPPPHGRTWPPETCRLAVAPCPPASCGGGDWSGVSLVGGPVRQIRRFCRNGGGMKLFLDLHISLLISKS